MSIDYRHFYFHINFNININFRLVSYDNNNIFYFLSFSKMRHCCLYLLAHRCILKNFFIFPFMKTVPIIIIKGDAVVAGNAKVYGDARVYGNAKVVGNDQVYDDAMIIE